MSVEFENGDLPELGRMEISCDFKGCAATDYFDGDFRECIEKAKSDGWQIYKTDNDWMHFCPEHNRWHPA